MDENNIKIDLSALDKLFAELDKNPNQKDLFYDDTYDATQSSASTISSVAGNTWPYMTTGSISGLSYPTNTTGGNGYTLTTNGTGSFNYNQNLVWKDNWQHDTKLKVQGDAEFDGDVKIKGRNISEMFEKIEQRLAILHPNEKLEEKWEELKKLGDAYRALEKDILEKEQIWNTLKK
jgi:hypothetical protein